MCSGGSTSSSNLDHQPQAGRKNTTEGQLDRLSSSESKSSSLEQVASYPTLMSMAASQQTVSMTGSRTSDDFVMVQDEISPRDGNS